MKRGIAVFTLALLAAAALPGQISAQISSTTAGGTWTDPATWVGGVVPGASSAVVIGGTVSVNTTVTVGSVTVSPGGILQNVVACDCTINITGSVVNEGVIRNGASNWWLYVRIGGDVTNRGIWSNYRTYLEGAGTQTLSQGAGTSFESPIESHGTLAAASDLTFSQILDLGGGVLQAGGHGITVRGSGYLNNGTVQQASFLAQVEGSRSAMEAMQFEGTTTIHGRVNVGRGNRFVGELVVADTLQNVPACDCTLNVIGNVVNNGTIRNGVSNYWLYLHVTGNLTNNGVWNNYRTYLDGTGDQTLSQSSGTFWDTPLESLKDRGHAYLASDVEFRKVLDMNADTLYAGTHSITVRGDGYLNEVNGFLDGAFAQYDVTRSALEATRLSGKVTVRGRVILGRGNEFAGQLTVADTLQNVAACDCAVTVEDIVNNGVIRNGASNWWLTLNVRGNLVNNGIWSNHQTYLTGTGNQTVSQAAGRTFSSPLESRKESGYTSALSDLDFSQSLDMNADSLYVGAHNITVRGDGFIRESNLFMTGELAQYGNRAALESSRLSGSVTIRNKVSLGRGVSFAGTLIVADTLQNVPACDCTATVEGALVNRGVIRNSVSNWWLFLHVQGSITDYGTWVNQKTYLNGDGQRTWWAPTAQTPFEMNGGRVVLTGVNAISNLRITADAGPTVVSGARLRLNPGVDDRIINLGEVYSELDASAGGTIPLYRSDLRIAAGAVDSLYVSHFGNQAPYTFANAVRTYWQLRSVPANASTSVEWIDLAYTDDELGTNNEDLLQVYHSADQGQTWRQVSTAGNLERHPEANHMKLTGGPASGTYALSSDAQSVTVLPTVITSVIGRDQIRVGPPNRYTVHYANNSDVATGDMMMVLTVNENVHIDHIEPSAPAGVKVPWLYPAEFAIYGDSTAAPPDTTAILIVQSMGPHEERSFDVVLNAFPDGWGKRMEPDDTEIAPVIGVVLWWAATGLATAYVTDVTFNVVEESFARTDGARPVIQEAFRKTNAKWFSFEKPATELAKDLALTWGQAIIGGTLGTAAVVAVKVGEGLFNTLKAFACGADRYVNGGQTMSGCVDKPVEKATSWDPNEKIGPDGVGAAGYVTDASSMTYQILFENKAEAQAPAWKIVVDDTLSAEFDPSTVVFEGASHEGFEFTITDNVLHWEVTGIELPPNVNPPEGEGYVQFTVKPRPGLPSGTVLANRAEIVFDFNDPILTNTYVNTLDFMPPVTTMEALPDQVPGGPLVLRWQVQEGAGESGVQSTNVFMAVDGGGFASIGSTFADSMIVEVQPGRAYAFYALSRDRVGNAEIRRPDLVSVSVVSGTGTESEQPFRFTLEPAWPNPFNPVTTFEYQVPEFGPTSLRVFDAIGRQVAVLLDEDRAPGRYRVQWDASTLSSGVYFYRLTQGSQVTSRAVVLLK